MSNRLFPSVPGLTWDLTLTPTFSTIIQKSSTRQEARLQQDPQPLYEFELIYEFLRDDLNSAQQTSFNPYSYTELEQIIGFFNQSGGSFDSFLLDPCMVTAKPGFNKSQGLQIGVGDGATKDFQLLWSWGGFVDQVQAPKGTPIVYFNGAIASGWTLSPLGIIHFSTAPAAAVVITADCGWYWKVRFSEDALAIKGIQWWLYECQSLKLQQVRDE